MKKTAENDNLKVSKFNFVRYIAYFFSTIIVIALIFYATSVIASGDKTLPKLTLYGKDISNLDQNQLKDKIKKINEDMKNEKITFEYEGNSVTKTYADLGVSIDEAKTVAAAQNFDRWQKYLISPQYFLQILKGNIAFKPVINFSSDSRGKFEDIFKDKIENSQNPTLSIENGAIKITPEKNGFGANVLNMIGQTKSCFETKCQTKIKIDKVTKKSNVKASDLDYYKDRLNEYVNLKITLTSDSKRVYATPADIVSLIDVERTVLNQKVTFSDPAIDDYLSKVADKVNITGRKKQISAVDGAVLSEGRAGIQLDTAKTRDSFKNALENKLKTAELFVKAADIAEETVYPGYTPGKYPGKYIEVNLSEQTMYLFEGTNMVGTYKVSTGKWSMPTPQGEFTINNKDPRAYSQEYNLYMPYWMAFIGSQYGIHELPEWPDGHKEGESHLGTPVSHGCIRLGQGSAETVYNWAEIGTPVYVHK